MSGRSKQELQDEIEGLRGELGEAVQILVHKADVATRAKRRGNELKEEAIERGYQMLERGSELRDQVVERGSGLRDQFAMRGNELRDQSVDAAERASEAVSRTPRARWVKLAGAGLALVTLTAIVRKVRIR